MSAASEPPSLADQLTQAQIDQIKQSMATASLTQYASLVPNVTSVPQGSLTAATGAPLFGDVVGYQALELVSQEIVNGVKAMLKDTTGVRLLVSPDSALATSESIYRQLRDQAHELMAEADALLHPADTGSGGGIAKPHLLVGTIASVAASAIPGILSMFSAQRSFATGPLSTDDEALAASLVGRLHHTAATKDWAVEHDTIRLLPDDSPTLTLVDLLTQHHDSLVAASLAATISADQKDKVTAVIKAIEQFTAAISTAAAGTNSPLTTALLREQLDADHPAPYTHVLIANVKAGAASGSTDHHMLGHDRFTTVGTFTASYFLLDVTARKLLKAETVTRSATGSGEIGKTMSFSLTDNGALDAELNRLNALA